MHGSPVDPAQLARIWKYFRTNTSVRACVNVLRSCILSGALVDRAGVPAQPVMERHCKRLLAAALDWSIVVGVVPVTRGHLQTGEGSRTRVPVVPGSEFVNITVRVDDETGQSCYAAQRRAPTGVYTSGQRHSKKAVLVWDTGQSTPLATGEVATDLATLANSETLLAIHRKHEIIANAARCNPVLVTQATKRTNSDMGGVNWLQPDDIYEESNMQGSQHSTMLAAGRLAIISGQITLCLGHWWTKCSRAKQTQESSRFPPKGNSCGLRCPEPQPESLPWRRQHTSAVCNC